MRSVFRKALIVLVVVSAMGALASASASAALPEFTGPFPKIYTLTLGNNVRLEPQDGEETITCDRETQARGSGEITSAKEMRTSFVFSECKWNTTSCRTSGASPGELRTETFSSALVYLSKAKQEVGILLHAYNKVTKKTIFIPQFLCGGLTGGPISGELIAPATPVNTKAAIYKISFKETKGKQEPSEYENELGERLKVRLSWKNFARAEEEIGLTAGENPSLNLAAETEIKA